MSGAGLQGARIRVIGPGAFHGETGIVHAVRSDGALLVKSDKHGDELCLDPRCVERVYGSPPIGTPPDSVR